MDGQPRPLCRSPPVRMSIFCQWTYYPAATAATSGASFTLGAHESGMHDAREHVPKLDGEFAEIEHLERISPSNNGCWQYPNYTDIQPNVDTEQILPIEIEADWDYSNDDKSVLHVSNVDEITRCFKDFLL